MANFFECVVKADLGGKVFPYDYRARLAYVTTHEDVVNEKCGRLDGRKS